MFPIDYKPAFVEQKELEMADNQYKLIMRSISEFEKNLDDAHEIALYLASFGQSVLMNVESISYANPSLIFFHGYVSGKPSTLIQHVNQLSFLLTSVAKEDPNRQARRIGFDLSDQ